MALWEERLRAADYRKIHGHCNSTTSENTKLGIGSKHKGIQVAPRRKIPSMTVRIQALVWFRMGSHGAAWENRLSELADYRKIHGHCNVPRRYSENPQWVTNQRNNYRLHMEGKKSHMTTFRIQALESLVSNDCLCAAWDERLKRACRLSQNPRHCNVPYHCSENTKLGIGNQRTNTGCT
jgi:hypothetical protein